MNTLIEKWQSLQLTSSSNIDHFIEWFQNHKAPVIRCSMLSDVREESGLGSPPLPFTTNSSETANFMLKITVNYQKNELPEFLQKYHKFINDQEREMELAVIGRKNYELRPQYTSWQLPESKWFSMNASQRKQYLVKFSKASLEEINSSTCGFDNNNTSSIAYVRDINPTSLSVSLDSFGGEVKIPRNCLEGIWNKALKF
jgi:hypothetical protein